MTTAPATGPVCTAQLTDETNTWVCESHLGDWHCAYLPDGRPVMWLDPPDTWEHRLLRAAQQHNPDALDQLVDAVGRVVQQLGGRRPGHPAMRDLVNAYERLGGGS